MIVNWYEAGNWLQGSFWHFPQITGNCHTKARLCKKWQNLTYQKKVRAEKKSDDVEKMSVLAETSAAPPASLFDTGVAIGSSSDDNLNAPEVKGFVDGPENIWSAGQNALRDLLLFLIQKHELDEVANPKTRFFFSKRPFCYLYSFVSRAELKLFVLSMTIFLEIWPWSSRLWPCLVICILKIEMVNSY